MDMDMDMLPHKVIHKHMREHYQRHGLMLVHTPPQRHSPCLTDGTCQDAKTQPWSLASLKWLSARRESSERASEWLSDFSFVLLSGAFLPATHWRLRETIITQTQTHTTGSPQSIALSRVTKRKEEAHSDITLTSHRRKQKTAVLSVSTDKWFDYAAPCSSILSGQSWQLIFVFRAIGLACRLIFPHSTL